LDLLGPMSGTIKIRKAETLNVRAPGEGSGGGGFEKLPPGSSGEPRKQGEVWQIEEREGGILKTPKSQNVRKLRMNICSFKKTSRGGGKRE